MKIASELNLCEGRMLEAIIAPCRFLTSSLNNTTLLYFWKNSIKFEKLEER